MDTGWRTWLKILTKGFRARKVDNHWLFNKIICTKCFWDYNNVHIIFMEVWQTDRELQTTSVFADKWALPIDKKATSDILANILSKLTTLDKGEHNDTCLFCIYLIKKYISNILKNYRYFYIPLMFVCAVFTH